MDYETYLREKISSLRLERNISEYQLSLDLGKCKTYIQAITSGKSLPSFQAFFDLCEYFDLTPEEFFSRSADTSAQCRRVQKKAAQLSKADLELLEQLLDRMLSKNTEREYQ